VKQCKCVRSPLVQQRAKGMAKGSALKPTYGAGAEQLRLDDARLGDEVTRTSTPVSVFGCA